MKLPLRVHRAMRLPFFALNALLGRYEPVVWLIGEGRSGTTWVAGLINANGRWREMFEPVHPRYVPAFAPLGLAAYRAPDEEDRALEAAMAAVFSGRMSHWRIDQTNRRFLYRGLIVKDVFASLLAAWAVRRFPQVRPVLLIRNPFAVALSKCATHRGQGWIWPGDPGLLTAQSRLMQDHLAPFAATLARAAASGDEVLRYLAIWAAVHRVLFEQFAPDRVHVAFYEEILADPEAGLEPLLRFVHQGTPPALPDAARIARASFVSSPEAIAARRAAGPDAWRRGLDDAQIEAGTALLEAFGLAGLYGSDGTPQREWLARFPIGDARLARDGGMPQREVHANRDRPEAVRC